MSVSASVRRKPSRCISQLKQAIHSIRSARLLFISYDPAVDIGRLRRRIFFVFQLHRHQPDHFNVVKSIKTKLELGNAKQKPYAQRIDRGDDRLSKPILGISLPVF